MLTAVQVQAIFWGAAWQQAPQNSLIGQLGNFFNYILQSPLMNALAEYGPIGAGQYLGSVILASPATGSQVSDTQIQQALQGWIQNQQVVQPGPNILYFVYLPPGVASTLNGQSSCVPGGYCGYHNHINSGVFYAVEAYLTCGGCQFGTGVFDSLTKVSSHELCEAITDPALNAWFDDNTGEEIGDICNGSVDVLGGFVVQREWSNSQGACVLTAPPPPQPPGGLTATGE